MQSQQQSQTCLTINDFMARNRIGRNTVYKEISSGRLKTIRVGRRRLIPQTCETDWINKKLTQ